MSGITTHVLDTALGRPAVGIAVLLERLGAERAEIVGRGITDADGRVRDLALAPVLTQGEYRLRFDTAAYFAAQDVDAFYPQVVVHFRIGTDRHYHVPLLLSPFGYSTYRGS